MACENKYFFVNGDKDLALGSKEEGSKKIWHMGVNDAGEVSMTDCETGEEKPLGGGGGVQPDWNQNDPEAADYVKGRTHNEEKVEKVLCSEKAFDGGSLQYIEGAGSHRAAFRPEDYVMPDVGVPITATINGVTLTGIVEEYTYTHPYTGMDRTVIGCGNLKLVAGSSVEDNGEIAFIAFDSSWVYVYIANPEDITVSVSVSETEIHPLPEKFIPSTVPVIPTATVGQTVVVKAVDADGKPTEWETADIPQGGGVPTCVIATTGEGGTHTATMDYAALVEAIDNGVYPLFVIRDRSSGWSYFAIACRVETSSEMVEVNCPDGAPSDRYFIAASGDIYDGTQMS